MADRTDDAAILQLAQPAQSRERCQMAGAGDALADAEAMTLLSRGEEKRLRDARIIAMAIAGIKYGQIAREVGLSSQRVSVIARRVGIRRQLADQPVEDDQRTPEDREKLWTAIRDEWRQNNRAVMDGLIL